MGLLRFYAVLSSCLKGHAVAVFLNMNVPNVLGVEIGLVTLVARM